MRELIQYLDEEAQHNLRINKHGSTNITAEQYREARARWKDAQLSNEVREFFFKKQDGEIGEKDSYNKEDLTNIEKVEPGVYGKVVVTRSVEKEKMVNDAK